MQCQGPEKGLKIGDIVLHKGNRGWFEIDLSHKGIGMIITELYKKQERKWVHKVWFSNNGRVEEIGAGALTNVLLEKK